MNKLEKCAAMTPKITHVICPDVDGLPEYLTAGKRYEVLPSLGGGFTFDDDNGQHRRGYWLPDHEHLNGADWIPVYGDSLGTTEVTEVDRAVDFITSLPEPTQPNWEDLGPRMREALEAVLNLHIAHHNAPEHVRARALIKEAEERT